ncbi:MAG TPA: BTAD domain-containing putative transcriptional regulator [Candidatus Elarobacter sp.]|nr:BTAD domain-containing putative transcriptional regulator [Candidatus Elarobacter sp.]
MDDLKPYFRSRPRTARDRIERPRLAAWFTDTQSASVRIVCAPLGSGKTCAVQQYADARGGSTGYVRVPNGADAATLRGIVARGGGFAEIVLDDVDRADPRGYRALLDDITDGSIEARLVLVARSRRRLQGHALVARGLAVACDPALLAFDTAETEALAAQMGVPHDVQDVAQMLHDTEGWALATQWLVRDAAESGRTLSDAFARWRERNGHLLLELVEQEGCYEPTALAAFCSALGDGWAGSQSEAEELEQQGLPIVRTRSGLRPYRILNRLARPAVAPHVTAAVTPMMFVNVFGRFRCEIAGQAVAFSRRRDQQVFTYVALAPECRTSRDELLDAFWPGINRTIAAPGLRTTLSRIRRAIADVGPAVDPERYFETTGEVRINARTVAIDVHRFVDHVEQARLDEARGSVEGAKHHYRLAQRIYVDRLLASEASEPCLEQRAREFEKLHVEVLTRVTELHAATGDLDIARDAARALLSCNTAESRRNALSSIAVEPVATA